MHCFPVPFSLSFTHCDTQYLVPCCLISCEKSLIPLSRPTLPSDDRLWSWDGINDIWKMRKGLCDDSPKPNDQDEGSSKGRWHMNSCSQLGLGRCSDPLMMREGCSCQELLRQEYKQRLDDSKLSKHDAYKFWMVMKWATWSSTLMIQWEGVVDVQCTMREVMRQRHGKMRQRYVSVAQVFWWR